MPANAPQALRELVAGFERQGVRGGDLVRAVLKSKGIQTDRDIAAAYDPPLTLAEQRHSVHVRFKQPQLDLCRLCRESETKEPADMTSAT